MLLILQATDFLILFFLIDSFALIYLPRLESMLHTWSCQNEFSSEIKSLFPLSPTPDKKL